MSIHLFKHNQEAYNSVTAMLEREKMAAVIHPTGTGKSLIAFKLAEEHPSEKFLWLSPSEYIYQTQLENLGMEFDNIQFMSYSRLMKNEDSIETRITSSWMNFIAVVPQNGAKASGNFWPPVQMRRDSGCLRPISAIWTTREIWQRRFLMERSHPR